MPMIKEVRHIGISVTDMDDSLRFYKDLLGFKIEREMNENGIHIDNMLSLDNVKVKTIKLSIGEENKTLIELLQFFSHPKDALKSDITKIGTSHFALTVNDLDQLYSKLKNKGIKFIAPPQISPDGYAKVTFCLDPDNTLIELVEVLNASVIEKPKNDKLF